MLDAAVTPARVGALLKIRYGKAKIASGSVNNCFWMLSPKLHSTCKEITCHRLCFGRTAILHGSMGT